MRADTPATLDADEVAAAEAGPEAPPLAGRLKPPAVRVGREPCEDVVPEGPVTFMIHAPDQPGPSATTVTAWLTPRQILPWGKAQKPDGS
jgi:hypothetical protein